MPVLVPRVCTGATGESPASACSGDQVGPVLQQVAPALALVDRRLGGPDEVVDDLHEALRVVLVREVAGVGDDLDPGAGRERRRVVRVADGDDVVVAAPDHADGHGLGEVGPVRHGHDLSPPVDDRPHDVPDGRPGVGVLERVVDVGHLGQVTRGPDAGARQGTHAGRADVPDAGEREQPHRLVEPRRGDRPDRRRHLGTETAGADQDEALGALGELVGELHRHAAAEAVAHHADPVDAQDGEQVAHAVGVAPDAVVGARLVRLAVPEQVGGDHGVAAGQRVDDRRPRRVVAAEAVQQEQGGPGAGDDVRTAVTVDRDVLDLRPHGCTAAAHRTSWGGGAALSVKGRFNQNLFHHAAPHPPREGDRPDFVTLPMPRPRHRMAGRCVCG